MRSQMHQHLYVRFICLIFLSHHSQFIVLGKMHGDLNEDEEEEEDSNDEREDISKKVSKGKGKARETKKRPATTELDGIQLQKRGRTESSTTSLTPPAIERDMSTFPDEDGIILHLL